MPQKHSRQLDKQGQDTRGDHDAELKNKEDRVFF